MNPTRQTVTRFSALCFTLLLFWGGTSSMVSAQLNTSYKNNLKLGYMRTGNVPNQHLLSFERSFGVTTSIQFNLGFRTRKIYDFREGEFFGRQWTYHAGLEPRFYFALRRKRLMSGFYFCPFLSYDRLEGTYPESEHVAYRYHYTSMGLGLGYQQVFLKDRIRLDGGMKLGKLTQIERNSYDSSGNLIWEGRQYATRSYFSWIQVGFAF